MRRRWPILVALLLGMLIGRLLGPCPEVRLPGPVEDQPPLSSPSPDEKTSGDSIVEDALAFIETLDRVEFPEGGEWAVCVRVVDGDTIVIETEEGKEDRVRYIGIDTPETVHPTRGVEPFGPEASAVNKELVEGERVYLVSDITDRDRYDRLLRYVYAEDGLFVNLALVACGLATVTTYPPDVAHVDEYVVAQEKAREAGRGMWGEEVEEEDWANKPDEASSSR